MHTSYEPPQLNTNVHNELEKKKYQHWNEDNSIQYFLFLMNEIQKQSITSFVYKKSYKT